jgi:predicted GIY-YIG superfamily endonuclease
MTDFFVYILECADGSFYTGHTDNLEQRLGQHQAGVFDGYTSLRRPVKLLWNTRFQTRDDAFSFERRVKNWSRAKKIALMASDWSALQRAAMPPGERDKR